MIKRVLCVMAAIMVASSSAMAWTAESFIGNDYDEQETYDFEPVYDYPMQPMRLMSARSTASASEMYEIDFMNPTSIEWQIPDSPYITLVGTQLLYMPSLGVNMESPFIGGSVPLPQLPSFVYTGENFRLGSEFFSISYNYEDDSLSSFVGWDYYYTNGYVVTYDIPIPDDTYAISFSPFINAFTANFVVDSYQYDPCNFSFFINDQIVSSYETNGHPNPSDRIFYTKEETFSYTDPIDSAKVVFVFNPARRYSKLPSDSSENGTVSPVHVRAYIDARSSLKVGFLGDHSALNMHNQEGQDSINQHNAIESEWTGSMTSNFNALSIETFSFPSGLISAFGLITGIFNDLWNGMGEYKIAYVFPLTLGIALLLIGRISKFAGGQSSGKRNRGDDGA